ncbi:hypothetical protein TRVA0_083S00166 [Trichomonascus vanleenenianus]|uniref:uncharacterized protein n=1 Tax=Trichomonascus vanleenenianus TaxID=2268995 RepID=UPI003ECA48BD
MPPSPTKRRQGTTASNPGRLGKRRKAAEEAVVVVPEEVTDDDVNMVIAHLSMPKVPPLVSYTYSNNVSNTEVQAYAKLAGATWTYYIKELPVIIGRSSPDGGNETKEGERIDIDLAPARVVSRKHAVIHYVADKSQWAIKVTGLNGVKINKTMCKEDSFVIESGTILDIGGVQMMFVLPGALPKIAPEMWPSTRGTPSKTRNNNNKRSPQRQARHVRGDSESTVNGTSTAHGTPAPTPPPAPQFQPQPAQPAPPPPPPPPQPEEYAQYYQKQQNTGEPVGVVAASSTPSGNSYPKGVAIITRPQVRGVIQTNQYQDQDLSSDDAKDIKPPYSYATMITQAILSSEEMMMSLADIYDWIAKQYSFYRHSKSGWQNSIRHNLSLNKAFEKVPRKANEPGKGMKWQITPEFKEEFIRKANMGRLAKGSGKRQRQQAKQQQLQLQQLPQQPQVQQQPQLQQQPQVQQQPQEQNQQPPPPPPPPQNPAMHFQNQLPPPSSFSPQQGPLPSLGQLAPLHNLQQIPSMHTLPSPYSTNKINTTNDGFTTPQKPYDDKALPSLPPPPPPLAISNIVTSPHRYPVSQPEAYTPDRGTALTQPKTATKMSSGFVNNMGGMNLNTPAHQQLTNLQLAPPSSAQQQQLPSSFLPGSSPAPFWKYMSTTPLRNAADDSPTKHSSPTVVDHNPTPRKEPDKKPVLGNLENVDLAKGFNGRDKKDRQGE